MKLTYKFKRKRGIDVLTICEGEPEPYEALLNSVGRMMSKISSLGELSFVFPCWQGRLMQVVDACVHEQLWRVSGRREGLLFVQPANWENVGETLRRLRAERFANAEAFAAAAPGYVPRAKRRFSLKPYHLRWDLDRMKWFCFFELEPPYRPWMKLWSRKGISNACAKLVEELRALRSEGEG